MDLKQLNKKINRAVQKIQITYGNPSSGKVLAYRVNTHLDSNPLPSPSPIPAPTLKELLEGILEHDYNSHARNTKQG